MLRGRTILCFASGYDMPPTSKHHVMHLLAEPRTAWTVPQRPLACTGKCLLLEARCSASGPACWEVGE
jgi:hypothetical protein